MQPGESNIHRDDPLFRASCALDEALGPEERERIDHILAGSAELGRDAAQLRKVDDLVRRWALDPVELDWISHARLIEAQAGEHLNVQQSTRLNSILVRWGGRRIECDEKDMARSVVRRLREKERDVRPLLRVFRIAAPLAAAAAVLLAVTAAFWPSPAPRTIVQVAVAPTSTMATSGEPGGSDRRTIVSFARSEMRTNAKRLDPGIGYLSIGADPILEGGGGAPL